MQEDDKAETIYKNGRTFWETQEYSEMEIAYQKAAKMGHVKASHALGHYYQITGNVKEMKKYYKQAIAAGYMPSANNLGYYYRTVFHVKSMLKYYNLAVEKGDISAAYNLGCFYVDIADYTTATNYLFLVTENAAAQEGYQRELERAYIMLAHCFKELDDIDSSERYRNLAKEVDLSEIRVVESAYSEMINYQ